MAEWFEEWFGEEYLRLYPHRDEAEAAAAVALIDHEQPLDGMVTLDLACGPGRHAVHLAGRGARVVAYDLSRPMLALAKQRTSGKAAIVRGDIRQLPFAPGRFDVVVNLFTSFGYFADDDLHRSVLREIRTLVRPGGMFVLDYFNSEFVRQTLVPNDIRETGSQRIVIERTITPDQRFVVKQIHLEADGRSFREQVRLFTPHDLERLLHDGGFTVRRRFGGYDGSPLDANAPRAIFLAGPA